LNFGLIAPTSLTDRNEQADTAGLGIRCASNKMKAMNKFLSVMCGIGNHIDRELADRGNTVALNAAGAPAVYDGYYDDYYGPFDDGYWGDGGAFCYLHGADGFRRDEGNHFATKALLASMAFIRSAACGPAAAL
jgi:hypothetical protein